MNDKEKKMHINNELKALTGDFCRSRIDEEYATLCEKMITKMSRKRKVPFLRGQKEIWAAGIIYTIGQINFLFDSSFEPYIPRADVCTHFNVSQSAVSSKAKRIRDMFNISYFDEDFSTQRSIDSNPLKNFVMLKNGLIVTTDQLKDMILSSAIDQLKEEEEYFNDLIDRHIIRDDTENTIKDNERIESGKKKKQRCITDY